MLNAGYQCFGRLADCTWGLYDQSTRHELLGHSFPPGESIFLSRVKTVLY